MLAPGFDITAEYVVRYADQNDDGHHMERLARLTSGRVFLMNGDALGDFVVRDYVARRSPR